MSKQSCREFYFGKHCRDVYFPEKSSPLLKIIFPPQNLGMVIFRVLFGELGKINYF